MSACPGTWLALSGVMPILSGDRPLAALSTGLDILSVAIWALLLWLVTRGSKVSLTHDLFGG